MREEAERPRSPSRKLGAAVGRQVLAAVVLAIFFGHIDEGPGHVAQHDHQVHAVGDEPVEARVHQVKAAAQGAVGLADDEVAPDAGAVDARGGL